MKNKLYLFVLLISISFVSCDTFHTAQGTIVDKETKMPLKNVEVYGRHGHKTETDSTGHFKLSYVTGRKSPYTIHFKYGGYKSSEITFENKKEQIIEIEKIKQ